jgi:hypothetical protein
VRTGLNQLSSYVSSLEPILAGMEGFLLVYRVGGPKLVLPQWVVKGGKRFAIVQVELGQAKETGHKAVAPVALTAAELEVDQIEPTLTSA